MSGSRARLGGVLLAAGRSRRFGQVDKLLRPFRGKPLLRWGAEALCAAPLADRVAVLRPEAAQVRAIFSDLPFRYVEADAGMGDSIAAGVRALGEALDGALILPGDMPNVGAGLLARLIARFEAEDRRAIVHVQAGEFSSPPVVWPRDLLGELCALSGEAGGKTVMARHRPRVAPLLLAADEAGAIADVDTPEDAARLAGD